MWPALIAAGAQIAGGLINRSGQQQTNAGNREIMAETNAFNAAEAQKQRDYETSMSNTQWQRGVADMRAAGLNPALAYQQGGAGTPGGSTASGVSTRLENPNAALGSSVSNAVSSAMDAMNQMQDLKNRQAQERNIDADTLNKTANTESTNRFRDPTEANMNAQRQLTEAQREKTTQEYKFLTDTQESRAATIQAQNRSLITNAAEAQARTNAIDQTLMPAFARKYIAPLLNTANGVADTAGKIEDLFTPFRVHTTTEEGGTQFFNSKGEYTGGTLTNRSSKRN